MALPIALALFSILAVGASVAGEQGEPGTSAIPNGTPDAAIATPQFKTDLVRFGDTLKVAIFELIEVHGEGEGAPKAGIPTTLKSYFQRMDLSGEYPVQQDGTLSLPRLGAIDAAGRPLADVRADVQSSFATVMGTPADVSLTIARRQPIYVTGAVKSSGAYDYVAGMIVIQAISLAGGIDRGAARSSQIIEHVRGAEKLDQTRDRLKRLLAKKARIEAASDTSLEISVPKRLIELAGPAEADRLINRERDILQATRRARALHIEDLDTQIAGTERQLALLQQRASQYDVQMEARTTRLSMLQELQQKGGVVHTSLVTAQSDLSDIEGRKQDFEITLAQTEQRLDATRSSRMRLETEDQLALSKELADTAADIADAERTLAADATSAQALALLSPHDGAAGVNVVPVIEIIRRTADARSTLPAEDTTELEPGDVVKVRLEADRSAHPLVAP
jgi:protein involved in polysaccharide export with SLBB domain